MAPRVDPRTHVTVPACEVRGLCGSLIGMELLTMHGNASQCIAPAETVSSRSARKRLCASLSWSHAFSPVRWYLAPFDLRKFQTSRLLPCDHRDSRQYLCYAVRRRTRNLYVHF